MRDDASSPSRRWPCPRCWASGAPRGRAGARWPGRRGRRRPAPRARGPGGSRARAPPGPRRPSVHWAPRREHSMRGLDATRARPDRPRARPILARLVAGSSPGARPSPSRPHGRARRGRWPRSPPRWSFPLVRKRLRVPAPSPPPPSSRGPLSLAVSAPADHRAATSPSSRSRCGASRVAHELPYDDPEALRETPPHPLPDPHRPPPRRRRAAERPPSAGAVAAGGRDRPRPGALASPTGPGSSSPMPRCSTSSPATPSASRAPPARWRPPTTSAAPSTSWFRPRRRGGPRRRATSTRSSAAPPQGGGRLPPRPFGA